MTNITNAHPVTLDWTHLQIIRLIKAVQKRPVLWNRKHPHFKMRSKKDQANQEIGRILGCNYHEVARKWQTVLSQYRREMLKIRTMGTFYDPKWFGFPHMNFLKPPRGRVGIPTYPVSSNYDYEIDEMLPDGNNKTEITNIKQEPEFNIEEDFDQESNVCQSAALSSQLPTSSNANDINSIMNVQDYDLIFAAAVAAKLKKINNDMLKVAVQRDIDLLLYDAIIGTGRYSGDNLTNILEPSISSEET